MSVTSGKAVGSQNVAKAGVNSEQKLATLVAGNAIIADQLITAGMPKLTWLITCTSANNLTVRPEVAFRRGAAGVDNYEFQPAAPSGLVSSAAPYTLEVNMPSQAMRVTVTAPGGLGNGTGLTMVLMASG